MRVDVAFTPAEAPSAPLAVVVDVMRAASTIAQALAGGYRRVLSWAEVEQTRALRDSLGDGVLAGENGTRSIVAAASRSREVVLGSLLNLAAVAAAVRERRADVVILCAGFRGDWCAHESLLSVVPRFTAMLDGAVEVALN